MSLPKKIAAIAAPIAGIVLLLAIPAWAEDAPFRPSNSAGTTSPQKSIEKHHSWLIRHTPGHAHGNPELPRVAHELR